MGLWSRIGHHLHTTARCLQVQAEPNNLTALWEDHQLDRLDQLINAIDTWNQWNTGHPTTIASFVDSLDALTHEADQAPSLALDPSQITSSQIDQLAKRLAAWLIDRGLVRPHRQVDRGADLGIDR